MEYKYSAHFFLRFSGSEFFRKLVCTKNQQDKEKPREYNMHKVFFWYQQVVSTLYCHLSSSHFTFSKFPPTSFSPLPQKEYAPPPSQTGICVYPDLHHHQSCTQYTKARLINLSDAPLQEKGIVEIWIGCLDLTVDVMTGVGHCCNFTTPLQL